MPVAAKTKKATTFLSTEGGASEEAATEGIATLKRSKLDDTDFYASLPTREPDFPALGTRTGYPTTLVSPNTVVLLI